MVPTQKNIVKSIIQIVCVLYLLVAVWISLRMNLENRSLWLDEAMLSFSFFRRNIQNLTFSSFELNQSAPVFWLYTVKLITLVFGTSEFWLRFFSFFSYVLMLFCSWYILSKILKTKFSLLGTCLIAGLFQMLRYSNEFKPYMTDCTTILILFVVYNLYINKKCNRSILNTVYVFSIWMSNPACFMIASLLLVELFMCIKEKRNLISPLISGVLVFVSFVIYFFYWLKPVIDEGFMKIYWENYKFSLAPTQVKNTLGLFKVILLDFSPVYWIVCFTLVLGFIANIIKFNNVYIHILYGAILISLIASALGLNPLDPRICLWYYPIFGILFTYFISELADKNRCKYIALAILLLIIIYTSKIVHYSNLSNNYKTYQEFNSSFEYVKNNITANDTVYIFNRTYPVFLYKNQLDSTSITPFSNNVIIGREQFDNRHNQADISKLKNIANLYLLVVYPENQYIYPLVDSLKIYGKVDTPYIQYETPVIRYRKNIPF